MFPDSLAIPFPVPWAYLSVLSAFVVAVASGVAFFVAVAAGVGFAVVGAGVTDAFAFVAVAAPLGAASRLASGGADWICAAGGAASSRGSTRPAEAG